MFFALFSSRLLPFSSKLIVGNHNFRYFVLVKATLSIILAVYLFTGSLFPGNSFANFSGLPILFQHYIYHNKIETPGISFYDFMTLHYCNQAHEKSDQAHHAKLPFHQQINNIPVDEIVYTDNLTKINKSPNSILDIKPEFKNIFFPSEKVIGIFHPPKTQPI